MHAYFMTTIYNIPEMIKLEKCGTDYWTPESKEEVGEKGVC